jgi:hypothetical protein
LPVPPTGSTRSAHIRLHSYNASPTTPSHDPVIAGRTCAAVKRRNIPRASSRSFPHPLPPSTRPLSGHCRAVWPSASLRLFSLKSKTLCCHWLSLSLRPSERQIYTTLPSLLLPARTTRVFFDWLEERCSLRNWTISLRTSLSILCTPSVL